MRGPRSSSRRQQSNATPAPETLDWLTRIPLFGLCAVVALAPLPFGSTSSGAVAVWTTALAIIAVLKIGNPLSSRDRVFLVALAVVGCCWIAVISLQLVPDSRSPIQIANPIWSEASKLLGDDLIRHASAVRNQPLLSAGAQIAFALSLMCGFLIGRNRICARILVRTFAISGLVYAVYGILNFAISPTYVLWYEKIGYRYLLTSTFINANTAAVYFGAVSIAWLLMMMEDMEKEFHPQSWRQIATSAFRHPSRQVVVCFVSFFITLTAALMTGSRFGSALALLLVCASVAAFFWRLFTRPATALIFMLSAAIAALALFLIVGGRVGQRLDLSGLADPARFKVYLATLRMIQDFPWLGTGLGTFPWTFPEYRPDDISIIGIWDRAHSTTLELAAEMGIPFAGLIVLSWTAIMIVLAWGIRTRKRDKILPAVAFWISSLAILHSQLDFSLQIPGFAIVIAAISGMGLAQSASGRSAMPAADGAGLPSETTLK